VGVGDNQCGQDTGGEGGDDDGYDLDHDAQSTAGGAAVITTAASDGDSSSGERQPSEPSAVPAKKPTAVANAVAAPVLSSSSSSSTKHTELSSEGASTEARTMKGGRGVGKGATNMQHTEAPSQVVGVDENKSPAENVALQPARGQEGARDEPSKRS
jgi:hypothetical protein